MTTILLHPLTIFLVVCAILAHSLVKQSQASSPAPKRTPKRAPARPSVRTRPASCSKILDKLDQFTFQAVINHYWTHRDRMDELAKDKGYNPSFTEEAYYFTYAYMSDLQLLPN